jgi:hypothetical protein
MLIPKKAFEIHALGAKEKTRYALNGILIKREADGRPVIVATDGRVLGRTTWNEPPADEYPEGPTPITHGKKPFKVLLPKTAIKEAQKLAPNRYRRPILGYVVMDETPDDTDSKPIRMVGTDLESWNSGSYRRLEGNFPDYAEVIPKYDNSNSITVALGVELLASVSATLKKFANGEGETGNTVRLTIPTGFESAGKPVVFKHQVIDGTETEIILMPINLEEQEKAKAEARRIKAQNETPEPEPKEEPFDEMNTPVDVSPDLSKEPEIAEAIAPPDNGTPVPPPPGIDEGMKRIRETEPEKKSKPSAMPPCTACKKTLTNHPSGLCHPCGTKSGERNGPAPVPCTTEGCKRKSLHSSGLCKKCRKAAGVTNGKPPVEPTKEPVSEPINDGWSPWFDLTVHALPAEYAEKTDLYQIQPGGSGVQWRRRL